MAKKKPNQPSLPDEVIEIFKFHHLPERDLGSVCGLIVDFLPTNKSKGVDYQLTIIIKDGYEDPNPNLSQRKPNLLTVKLFGSDVNFLPPVGRTGDVIWFKRLKAVIWQKEMRGLSTWDSTWAIFPYQGLLNANLRHSHDVVDPHNRAPVIRPEKAGDVSRELQDYAISLGNRLRDQQDLQAASAANQVASVPTGPRQSLPQAPKPPMPTTNWNQQVYDIPQKPVQAPVPTTNWNQQVYNVPQQPFRPSGVASFFDARYQQVSDLTRESYSATIIGEVVKMFDSFQYLDVYVTDYTSSPLLYDRKQTQSFYNDRQFAGPLGRMTIKIELHNPHRDAARLNFSEKSIVMFRNVRCKMANSGEGLEGTLWPDKKFPDKIHVLAPDSRDSRVSQLLERRNAYLGLEKPENALAGLNGNGEDISKSKKKQEKKKKTKSKRDREEAEKRGEATKAPADAAPERNDVPMQAQDEEPMAVQDDDIMTDGHNGHANGIAEKHPRPTWANPRIWTSSIHEYSSYDEVVNNPKRQIVIPLANGIGTGLMQVPFVNVNHHVLLRIVDYHPQDVWEFARPVNRTNKLSQDWISDYEWRLTLLVVPGEHDRIVSPDNLPEPIAIQVHDEAGRELLGVSAPSIIYDEDDQKILARAQERFLSLVGSDLPNAKEAASNDTSEATSPTKNGRGHTRLPIWPRHKNKSVPVNMSRPFEACIREYGEKCEHDNGDDEERCPNCECGWIRMYELHSTRVVDAEEVPFVRKDPDEGRLMETAISLDDSDGDPMDTT